VVRAWIQQRHPIQVICGRPGGQQGLGRNSVVVAAEQQFDRASATGWRHHHLHLRCSRAAAGLGRPRQRAPECRRPALRRPIQHVRLCLPCARVIPSTSKHVPSMGRGWLCHPGPWTCCGSPKGPSSPDQKDHETDCGNGDRVRVVSRWWSVAAARSAGRESRPAGQRARRGGPAGWRARWRARCRVRPAA